jgi:RNA methyltransferase, TrmH family
VITSLQNPRIKAAIKLRDSRQRQKQRRIIIDGARELVRALKAGVEIVEIFVCKEMCRSDDCRSLLESLSAGGVAEVVPVTRTVFEKLAFGARSEGVVGVARMPATSIADLMLPRNPLVAVLEGVEKPGNTGAVLRTADAAGISALIVADGGTDLYNPNAIRASLGTIFTVPVCTSSSAETLAWLRRQEIGIYIACVDATTEYTQTDFSRPCAIVLGSEATGLTDVWRETAGTSASSSLIIPIKLPMLGVADSLNVSTAAAILFYEALRQRRTVSAR